MKKENSSLLDENKVMQAEISQRFRQEGVPFVCRCRWYYSVFYPTDKLDFVVCAAILFLCVFLIPFIVTRFIDSVGVKILVWILIAAFFAGLYFLIKAWTQKGNRLDEIIKARSSILKIAENRSRIKKINRNIKADPDESQYNLSEYDYMVDTARKECDEIKARRDEAVKYFEEKESVEIRTKMENEYAAVLEDLDKDIRQLQNELDERNAGFKAAVDESAVYAAALGDKYYKAEKIDELIGIISEGRAENIGQALETLTNKKAGTWQKTEEAETKEEE
ncbi:MAG: hypothetical protein HUJ76_10335 [Parasporobacterium sp.]|nr:hypothetical protein [Parasporobacterium sp.]